MCFFAKFTRVSALFLVIFNVNASIANESVATKTTEVERVATKNIESIDTKNTQVDASTNGGIKNRVTLPPVTIDEYENEIKALQKLQRDNARLKLEVEKAKSLQELKKYGLTSVETSQSEVPKVWVISVYKMFNGRFRAQVIDPIKGIRVVSIGDEVSQGFFVYKISNAGVIVRSRDNMLYTLLFTPMGTWVA